MTTKTIVGAVLLALASAGCAVKLTEPSEILGTTWHLESLQRANAGGEVRPPAGEFTLRFTDEGRLEVRADCNGCGGGYTLDRESLRVGPLACTRVFCPSAPFDTDYATLVESATIVQREGDTLVMRGPAGVLRFVR
jgi:heat shock protein HslJ